MVSSKYLPPFDDEQRAAVSRAVATPRARQTAPGPAAADGDVTYADFLGDEVVE